jgi:hypothetical protein
MKREQVKKTQSHIHSTGWWTCRTEPKLTGDQRPRPLEFAGGERGHGLLHLGAQRPLRRGDGRRRRVDQRAPLPRPAPDWGGRLRLRLPRQGAPGLRRRRPRPEPLPRLRGWDICYEEGADTEQGTARSGEGGDPCFVIVQPS